MPSLTFCFPIRVTVRTMSLPIRMRSPVFRVRINIAKPPCWCMPPGSPAAIDGIMPRAAFLSTADYFALACFARSNTSANCNNNTALAAS